LISRNSIASSTSSASTAAIESRRTSFDSAIAPRPVASH
jgi:hypothetical protein